VVYALELAESIVIPAGPFVVAAFMDLNNWLTHCRRFGHGYLPDIAYQRGHLSRPSVLPVIIAVSCPIV